VISGTPHCSIEKFSTRRCATSSTTSDDVTAPTDTEERRTTISAVTMVLSDDASLADDRGAG